MSSFFDQKPPSGPKPPPGPPPAPPAPQAPATATPALVPPAPAPALAPAPAAQAAAPAASAAPSVASPSGEPRPQWSTVPTASPSAPVAAAAPASVAAAPPVASAPAPATSFAPASEPTSGKFSARPTPVPAAPEAPRYPSSPDLRAAEPERRSRESVRSVTATPVPPAPAFVLPKDPRELEVHYARFRETFLRIRDEIGRVIVGQREVIEGVLTCFLAKGNVLLEGVPGLGKTLLVRTFAQTINCSFSRVQFTPDLMPADITGTNIVTESETGHRRLRFQPGPIFANIILADEINRATPKTQSALLEAMQEHSVTVGGKVRLLEEPFFVLATQNPVEQEGTYPLPEAQLDRFLFKLVVPFPELDELHRISSSTTGATSESVSRVSSGQEILELREIARTMPIAPPVERYAARLIMGTHPGRGFDPEMVKRFVRYGSSPRGVQALVLAAKIRALVDGRFTVSCEDIRTVAMPVLRHRLILNFEGEAEGISTDQVVKELLVRIPENDRSA